MSGRSDGFNRGWLEHVIATYAPLALELPAPVRSVIGRRGRFRLVLRDHGGEEVMAPVETWDRFPFVSCRRSDLQDVETVGGPALERRRNGRSRD